MKTNLFSRITLAGLLLSAAVASNAALAQGTEAPVAKPVTTHQVAPKQHAHKALHKTSHKVKHHKKSQSKSTAPTATPAPVEAPAQTPAATPSPSK